MNDDIHDFDDTMEYSSIIIQSGSYTNCQRLEIAVERAYLKPHDKCLRTQKTVRGFL